MLGRYALILAGGTGTRLWPMSRADLPKQLIPFISPKICDYPLYLSETTNPSLIGPVPFSVLCVPRHCGVFLPDPSPGTCNSRRTPEDAQNARMSHHLCFLRAGW